MKLDLLDEIFFNTYTDMYFKYGKLLPRVNNEKLYCLINISLSLPSSSSFSFSSFSSSSYSYFYLSSQSQQQDSTIFSSFQCSVECTNEAKISKLSARTLVLTQESYYKSSRFDERINLSELFYFNHSLLQYLM